MLRIISRFYIKPNSISYLIIKKFFTVFIFFFTPNELPSLRIKVEIIEILRRNIEDNIINVEYR